MNSKQEQTKVVFWEYISTDTNGDITIKIKSKEAQQELQALVQAGDAKLAKELEAKKKKLEAVTLKDIEAFDNAIAELIDSDAVYVKAGKMTGRNLVVDWDKADGKNNSTGNKKQGTKQKKQLEVIHVDAQFEF
jgi:restriction endonuclease S subunit